MHIGLNFINFSPGAMGGQEVYGRELLKAFWQMEKENQFGILCDRRKEKALQNFFPAARFRAVNFDQPSVKWLYRGLLKQGMGFDPLSLRLRNLEYDVLHHPFTVLNPRGLKTPSVLTFHDMQHEYYPQYFSKAVLHMRKTSFQPSVQEATRVIAISGHVRDCLINRYGTPAEKIAVVYNGVGKDFRLINGNVLDETRKRYQLDAPFIFFPAGTWPHKNHSGLFQALRILIDQGRFGGELVLSGIAQNSHDGVLERISELSLQGHVRLLGYLPFEDLPEIYNLARVMVFPSFFEGFGLPVVEAMACGCPVACSNVTSLPEVAGDAAYLFDPGSPEDMAEAILKTWEDDELRQELREKGLARARHFDWAITAGKTLRVYREAAEAA